MAIAAHPDCDPMLPDKHGRSPCEYAAARGLKVDCAVPGEGCRFLIVLPVIDRPSAHGRGEAMEDPLFFTVTSSEDPESPLHFQLGKADDPLKVGRNKKSGIVVNQPGVSWVHLEIKLSPGADGLCLRDVSTNGVGLRRRGAALQKVEKEVDTDLPSGTVVVLPFRVRPAPGQTEASSQTSLTFSIDGEDSLSPSSELTESEDPDAVAADAELNPQEENGKGLKARGKRKKEKDKHTKDKKRKTKHEFSTGQFVRVVGLKAKGELNGKVGLLVEWDEAKGYWKVRMEDGSGKAFRSVNLEPHVVPPPAPAAGSKAASTVPPPPPDEPAPKEQSQVPPPPPAAEEEAAKVLPLPPPPAAHVKRAARPPASLPGAPAALPAAPMSLAMPLSALPMTLPTMMPLAGLPMGMPVMPPGLPLIGMPPGMPTVVPMSMPPPVLPKR
ncbi:unnamed protein product [Symbiodinium sp. CCMP2592]|nr:unnamed protein product [Symbiodinium sp. CCMP2592]